MNAVCENCGTVHVDDSSVISTIDDGQVVDGCAGCGYPLGTTGEPAAWRRLMALEDAIRSVWDGQVHTLASKTYCDSHVSGKFDRPCRVWTYDYRKWCDACQLMNEIDALVAVFSGWQQCDRRGLEPAVWRMRCGDRDCEIQNRPNDWHQWRLRCGPTDPWQLAHTLGEAVGRVREIVGDGVRETNPIARAFV